MKEAKAMTALPRSAPEAQGISSRALTAFLDAAERDVQYMHGLVVVRHGHVVAEGYWAPFDAATPHMLFSLSKSFTSSAIGMLVGAGKLSVDDKVLDFFPDEAPADPSPRLRAMTVRHLLTMTSGHEGDPTRPVRQKDVNWVRTFFETPLVYEPGAQFSYNSGATYMCSAIAQKITGQRLLDFLGPRLFAPLGFEAPTWEQSPQGIDTGGWGLKARTAEIARFAQLYLQGGVWQGEQLVPASWVAQATASQVPNSTPGNPNQTQPDWLQGYGYQFWRCRDGAYRGDGANGQFSLVLPEQDAAIAITSGVGVMQRVLDLVWEHLLPAMGPAALPADRAAEDALSARLAGLSIPTPTGARTSSLAAELTGRPFVLESNAEGIASLSFEPDGSAVVVRTAAGDQRLAVGHGAWVRGELALAGFPSPTQPTSTRVAAAGAWTDDHTYVLHLWSYDTPWRTTWTCRFAGDRLRIEREMHPGSATNPQPPVLEARAAAPVA
jgi:CubicO group peptidase (beta-lactamase class C family)